MQDRETRALEQVAICGSDRRAFLRRMAALGGGAALGSGASAMLEVRQTPGPEIRSQWKSQRTAEATSEEESGALVKATGKLRLRSPVEVANIRPVSGKKPMGTPDVSRLGRVPRRATRDQLLDAIARKPGGPDLLRDLGITREGRPATQAVYAGPDRLRDYADDLELVRVYEAGVTLYPRGCECEEPGYYSIPEPLSYQTTWGYICPTAVEDYLCWTVPFFLGYDGDFLSFHIAGFETRMVELYCLLHLCLVGVGEEDFSVEFNDTPLEMAELSDGTFMAIVALPPRSGANQMQLFGHNDCYAEFQWLSVWAISAT